MRCPGLVVLLLFPLSACENVNAPTALLEPALQLDHLRSGDFAEAVAGSGHYTVPTGMWEGRWRTFSFSAIRQDDGSVTGTFHSRVHGANGDGSRLWGDVSCFVIEGDQAWIAGILWKAGNPNNVGTGHGFRVVDNGQGKGAVPDELTVTWSGNTPPEMYCQNKPTDRALHPIEAGNITIYP